VDAVGRRYPFPQHCNGLIANLLLYNTDSALADKLKEPRRIRCQLSAIKKFDFVYFSRRSSEASFSKLP
jgi:hypothetical protein